MEFMERIWKPTGIDEFKYTCNGSTTVITQTPEHRLGMAQIEANFDAPESKHAVVIASLKGEMGEMVAYSREKKCCLWLRERPLAPWYETIFYSGPDGLIRLLLDRDMVMSDLELCALSAALQITQIRGKTTVGAQLIVDNALHGLSPESTGKVLKAFGTFAGFIL